MSALLASQQISRTAQFKVECRNLEACPEIAELLQGRQPAPGHVIQFAVRSNQQICVCAAIRASNPPAQLVQFAQPMAVRAI